MISTPSIANTADPRLKILLIDAGLPNPQFDAGSRALVDFIDIMRAGSRERDVDLHFLAMGHNAWGRKSDLIERNVGIHASTKELLSSNGQNAWLDLMTPDIVVVSRPGPASQWLSTVLARNKVSIGPRFFYYGHDIHHQRLAQQLLFEPQPAIARQQKLYHALEQAIWSSFSVVIYGSKTECEHVNNIVPDTAIHLPLYVVRDLPSNNHSTLAFVDNTPSILWVGGAHHAPNRDALTWLIREVLPLTEEPIRLNVVGDWPIHLRQHLSYQPVKTTHAVQWLGQLEQALLERAYQTCDFAVAPLRFGAGVKGKVFEAIARQCPVLTTPVGAQGLEHFDWPDICLSEADAHAMAQSIKSLLTISPRKKFAKELQSMRAALVHESKMAPRIWSNLI
jgi:glycosyltransferase involved in cell wall biosynthesis